MFCLEFFYKVQNILRVLWVAGFFDILLITWISSLKKQPILTGKMQNHLHEISYIACVLIHFYKELAIERSLLNRVGCIITWVRGCVDCVGQIFTWVEWVTWLKIFFTWVIIFSWVKYIFVWVQNFCIGFFLRGSAFFTRWDYFSILQLMKWAFFLSVFLSGLLEIK